MNYNIKKAIERIKSSEYWEGREEGISLKGYINAGVEVNDHGRGLEVECSVYANKKLATGANFDEAFAAWEKNFAIVSVRTDADPTATV